MPWAPKPARPKQRPKDTRQHAAARGYDYQWQKFREMYLASNPLCMDCLPIVTAATDIHHRKKLRDRPELKYEEENLMALCKACHDRRTAKGE
jgi:5-methylcytosine-specific restriction protein A